ncbi:MAG: NAD(P)H-hydrate epimerase [Planctomycetota bacterium]
MKRDQVRQIDQIAIEQYGLPGVVLMENAGRGCAVAIDQRFGPQPAVKILCGGGNNGGDGYVIARHLELMGHSVQVISLVPLTSLHGDAAVHASVACASDLPVFVVNDSAELGQQLTRASLLVDCMLGTGAVGSPRGLYKEAIEAANESTATRIAIDLPSGLDCDTGIANEPTFRADHTLTFVAAKDGFANHQSKAFVGAVSVIDIGVPLRLLRQFGLPKNE